MSKKILIVSNMLFCGFVAFLLSFIWIQYYSSERYTALVLASIVAMITLYVSYAVQNSNIKKGMYSKRQEKTFKEFTNYLIYSKMPDIDSLLQDTFADYVVKKSKDKLSILFRENRYDIYNMCHKQIIMQDDIIGLIKSKNIDCTVPNIIVCIAMDNDAIDMISSLSNTQFLVCDAKELYEICSTYNTIPKNMISIKNKKVKIVDILKCAISKDKWKGYLFASITIAFYSLFVFSKLYYIIWSTILATLSIISYYDFFKYSKSKQSVKNIFCK